MDQENIRIVWGLGVDWVVLYDAEQFFIVKKEIMGHGSQEFLLIPWSQTCLICLGNNRRFVEFNLLRI